MLVSVTPREEHRDGTPDHRTDELRAWVDAAREGDRRAEEQLLGALAPRMLAVARGVLGASDADVEDAAQESLVAVFRALPAFRGESHVARFAGRIAVRTCMATRRKQHTRRQRERDAATNPDRPASIPPSPSRQRLAVLRGLLDELPPDQGETLAMRVVLGCSIDEIASATDVPANTARSRLRLAKAKLHDRIARDDTLQELLEVTL